jgi:rhamnosyltransferase
MGVRALFFSNVSSAVKADVFWKLGGFPEGVIFGEDVMLCAKVLRAGYKVKYEANARVYHSHSYSVIQQFKRTFDNGVSFSRARCLLGGARITGEGLRFVLGQANYVWRSGSAPDLIKVFGEAAARVTAFNLGRLERYIPRSLKRHMSMQERFWLHS